MEYQRNRLTPQQTSGSSLPESLRAFHLVCECLGLTHIHHGKTSDATGKIRQRLHRFFDAKGSLRERIYASPAEGTLPDRYGILIFTGSSDAEGTLGGLVEAARRTKEFGRKALELASLCSNDPLRCGGKAGRKGAEIRAAIRTEKKEARSACIARACAEVDL